MLGARSRATAKPASPFRIRRIQIPPQGVVSVSGRSSLASGWRKVKSMVPRSAPNSIEDDDKSKYRLQFANDSISKLKALYSAGRRPWPQRPERGLAGAQGRELAWGEELD